MKNTEVMPGCNGIVKCPDGYALILNGRLVKVSVLLETLRRTIRIFLFGLRKDEQIQLGFARAVEEMEKEKERESIKFRAHMDSMYAALR